MEKKYTLEDLEKVLDKIPYGIALQDEDNKYVFINKSFYNELNMKKEDIIGKHPSEILGNKEWSLLQKIILKSSNSANGVFSEFYSTIDNNWYDLYSTQFSSNNVNFTESIFNRLSNNMTYVYNSLYSLHENDSMDFLEFDTQKKNLLPSEDLKNKISILCQDLKNKVKADNINIYFIDDKAHDINLFLSTNVPFELCDFCKKNILNINFSDENYNCFDIIKNCPRTCTLFKNQNDLNKIHFKVFPIKYGPNVIGLMFVSYDKEKLLFNGDSFIKSLCYKLGILTENISIKKRLENTSKENIMNMNKLKLFMENSHDFFLSVTKGGMIISASKNIIDTLGWTKSELADTRFIDFIHPADKKSTYDYVYDIQKRKKIEGSDLINKFRCKNGTYKLIKWHWAYKTLEDAVMLTGKDITIEKKLEEENKKIHEELQEEVSKLQFFSNMSHEFRTPLNIILTSAQLMKMQLNNLQLDKAERNLQYITQNSYRLLKLTNNILDVTKIDYGSYDFNLENCNIVEVIENIVTSVADYIKSFDKKIIFDTEQEEIITACDTDKIERIMLNLLSNALKYVNDNGTIKVNMSLSTDKDEILISVWDEGIPIKPENSEKIFELYNKIDNSLTRQCEGGGIGLSLAKAYVEMHNGRIWANTAVDTGAEIIITLPIRNVKNHIKSAAKTLDAKIEKCNIELSDIYSLTR